ncbi:MAG: DUF3857 domain-containing protein [Nibricoccus sp.]
MSLLFSAQVVVLHEHMAVPAPLSLPRILKLAGYLCLILALTGTQLSAGNKWPPIDPAVLTDKTPKIDPEAGAEVLLRTATLDHSSYNAAEDTFYIRAKIYDQRGVEAFSKVEIAYEKSSAVRYISARTIKPDGTTVELNSKDIYDREAVKYGDKRERIKSFAMPALSPGCIVEYTYTVITNEWGGYNIPLIFQREHPARKVQYKVKLASVPECIIKTINFNCPPQPLKPDKNGFYVFEMNNLLAAKDESYQPPTINTLSAILIYYSEVEKSKTPQEYWANLGKEIHKKMEEATKPTKALRAAMDEIAAKTDSDRVKLHKIYDFCRTKILNRDNDASGLTSKQREKLKPNETATDTLKSGSGKHDDINLLFAALARIAGFDTRYVACNDRSFMLFNSQIPEAEFLTPDRAVAIRKDKNWEFFDPGCTYFPFGVVHWSNTGTAAIISDPSGHAAPIMIEPNPPEQSVRLREAELVLDEDGNLEGKVTQTFTGHEEYRMKRILDGKTEAERETFVRESIQDDQKQAEVTQIVVKNAASPTEPLVITYILKIPQYGDKTGSRLFFQPAVFQKGAKPTFESDKRRTAIIFNYCYVSRDHISIKFPAEASLEEASAPADLDFGELASLKSQIRVHRKNSTLELNREFTLKGLAFDKKLYPALKTAFDQIQKTDAHTLTLKFKPNEPDASPKTSGQEKTTTPETPTSTEGSESTPAPSDASRN